MDKILGDDIIYKCGFDSCFKYWNYFWFALVENLLNVFVNPFSANCFLKRIPVWICIKSSIGKFLQLVTQKKCLQRPIKFAIKYCSAVLVSRFCMKGTDTKETFDIVLFYHNKMIIWKNKQSNTLISPTSLTYCGIASCLLTSGYL